MNNKKAQINQVFVWIIVALVIGATALVGVRSIGGLLNDKCSIDLISFEDRISEKIQLNNDFGSVNLESLTTPCDYSTVCFVDARMIGGELEPSTSSDKLNNNFNIIQNSVEGGVEANVFLFNGKEIYEVGYVSQLWLNNKKESSEPVPNNIFCVDAQGGKISLVLEGLGKNTYVTSEDEYNKNNQ